MLWAHVCVYEGVPPSGPSPRGNDPAARLRTLIIPAGGLGLRAAADVPMKLETLHGTFQRAHACVTPLSNRNAVIN